MTHASVSPLRQRLIDDMTIRHFAPRTQQGTVKLARVWDLWQDLRHEHAIQPLPGIPLSG
jgi:hypothetical protein